MPVLTWPWTTVSHESPALLGATLSTSVFPQHWQRLQTTRLPPLSTVKPNAVRPDFHLESLQKVFSPFHTSWPDCFCLFTELIDMYKSYYHEALGGVMDKERSKWLKLQQASKTNKNENCWICCLCIFFANYWFVSVGQSASRFKIYPKREEHCVGINWKCLLVLTAKPICRTWINLLKFLLHALEKYFTIHVLCRVTGTLEHIPASLVTGPLKGFS